MAESAGALTFTFGADFSGFSRAADSAGKALDDLGRQAAQWASESSASAARAVSGPLQLTGGMARAAQALRQMPKAAAPAGDDAQADKTLERLRNQLALLQTTGAAHDAIAQTMKIETEQAKLGTDATNEQKAAVAALVGQIDAAKTAQAALKSQQDSVNDAWSFGADTVQRGIESMVLSGGNLQSFARSTLVGFTREGLSAALTGSGSLAGLFGTTGSGGRTGGLFGAVQSLFTGGLSGLGTAMTKLPDFSGLYASGGSIASGQWGIAGEAGPEVVHGPATVVPWNKVAGLANGGAASTPQVINFNVTTPDAPSFARSEGQMSALLSRAVARGQRNQ